MKKNEDKPRKIYLTPKQKEREKKKKEKLRKEKVNKYKRDKYRKERGLKTEDEIKEELRLEKLRYRKSWKIIMTSLNINFTDVITKSNQADATELYYKILSENNSKIRFPVKFLNYDEIIPAKYELLLLKKRLDGETLETLFRNEIGQFSPVKTNNDKWQIFAKNDLLMEESFWVYGFNPLHDRKNFNYILKEIVLKGDIKHVKYPIKRIMVMLNKLIIEDENYDFDMVICKNKSDCIRLYNELEKDIIDMKIKSVLFAGFVKSTSRTNLKKRIIEKTGWDIIKINRSTTKP